VVHIPLRGAGGERVDLQRTLRSHGVADLPPNRISAGVQLSTVLSAGGAAWSLELAPGEPGDGASAVLRAAAGAPEPPAATWPELTGTVRHMLRLDEDLGAFYAIAGADPDLAWVPAAGAGRLLRSPTVFEDVVKTICTTNCAWSGTVRMVSALVSALGAGAEGVPERHAFPSPAAVAQAPAEFFVEVARAGYRGPYLRRLATAVAGGELDLEALGDPSLSDELVREQLLEIDGVGPYAAAHVMMLLGRYRPLILDSWTRPTYRRLAGRPRVTDRGIVRAFARYREFAGLAFWLTLTRGWVDDG
jgi:3-methyladenine DNA glycosylase/8-oxoguanine DNA glycosylase